MGISREEFEGLQALVIKLSERVAKLEVNSEYHKEIIEEFREKIRKLEK